MRRRSEVHATAPGRRASADASPCRGHRASTSVRGQVSVRDPGHLKHIRGDRACVLRGARDVSTSSYSATPLGRARNATPPARGRCRTLGGSPAVPRTQVPVACRPWTGRNAGENHRNAVAPAIDDRDRRARDRRRGGPARGDRRPDRAVDDEELVFPELPESRIAVLEVDDYSTLATLEAYHQIDLSHWHQRDRGRPGPGRPRSSSTRRLELLEELGRRGPRPADVPTSSSPRRTSSVPSTRTSSKRSSRASRPSSASSSCAARR